jgi:hypothetical protein
VTVLLAHRLAGDELVAETLGKSLGEPRRFQGRGGPRGGGLA